MRALIVSCAHDHGSQLQRHLFQTAQVNFNATWLRSDDATGYVLQLVISKTRAIVLATEGHPYVRQNAQNFRVYTADDLHRLNLDKGITTFEDDVVNVTPAADRPVIRPIRLLKMKLCELRRPSPRGDVAIQFETSNCVPEATRLALPPFPLFPRRLTCHRNKSACGLSPLASMGSSVVVKHMGAE